MTELPAAAREDFAAFDRVVEDLATATRITARFLDRFARLPEVAKVP